MRCTEPNEMPMASAIARPVHCVAWCGGSVQVSATTRARVSAAIGALPGFLVLSRSRPSTPLSAKRCCHRHTVGRLTPMLWATRCAECRSAEARTMRARSTCLRGRLRSAAIAANCSRSASLKITHTCCAMAPIPHPPKPRPNIAHPGDRVLHLYEFRTLAHRRWLPRFLCPKALPAMPACADCPLPGRRQ